MRYIKQIERADCVDTPRFQFSLLILLALMAIVSDALAIVRAGAEGLWLAISIGATCLIIEVSRHYSANRKEQEIADKNVHKCKVCSRELAKSSTICPRCEIHF